MRARAGHALDDGEAAVHEGRQLLERARLAQHHQVIRAAHQIDGLDLVILHDALGDRVKALLPLGNDVDLDHRLHEFALGALPVDQRLIPDQHACAAQAVDRGVDLPFIGAGHHGDLARGHACVLAQNLQNMHIQRGKHGHLSLQWPEMPAGKGRNRVIITRNTQFGTKT